MTKHYRDNDIEIIPPSRPVSNINPTSLVPEPTRPYRQDVGGVISGIPQRWTANVQAETFDAYTRRAVAQQKFVEADTELGRALIANSRVQQEHSELPQVLAADKLLRGINRDEEIFEAYHQVSLNDKRRTQEATAAELGQYALREQLLDAEQRLDALRHHGPRYHALQWEHRINEWELQVEEQRVVLGEHRRHGRDEPSLDDLYAARDQLNGDGADTTPIDLAIARAMVRQQKARK